MNDSERTMKYFIIFAAGSAAVLPICAEVYANVSHGIAGFLLMVWAMAAAWKFGTLPGKNALLGCAAFLLSSMVLSMVGFAAIHPTVKNWLTENSRYFDMTAAQWLSYWVQAFTELAAVLPITFIIIAFRRLMNKAAAENEKTAAAIENAFGEDEF